MTITYITKPTEPERTYPWVGRLDTEYEYTTVLFVGPDEGFCLDSTDKDYLKFRESDNWSEEDFIPCSITLSSL